MKILLVTQVVSFPINLFFMSSYKENLKQEKIYDQERIL